MAYFDLSKLLTRAVYQLWHERPGTLFKIKYLGDFLLVFPQIFRRDACEQAKHLIMYLKALELYPQWQQSWENATEDHVH